MHPILSKLDMVHLYCCWNTFDPALFLVEQSNCIDCINIYTVTDQNIACLVPDY
jgi:hypothetical protein